MHVYTASITTTTILTPAVQNLNVKMSWTDNLYSYIIKDKYQLYQKHLISYV